MQKVILVAGWPGAGKTTLSYQLKNHYKNTVLLDKDITLAPIIDSYLDFAGYQKGDYVSEFYKRNVSPSIYKTLEEMTQNIIKGGFSVILTAPYGSQSKNHNLKDELEDSFQAPVYIIWLTASIETLFKRRVERDWVHDQIALSDWQKETSFIDPDFYPDFDHLHIQTDNLSKAEIFKKATDWLESF
jgi:predicted kinase